MIKVKLSAIGNSESTILEILPEEILSSAIERSLKGLIPSDCVIKDFFIILVNGMEIKSDMWDFVRLQKSDIVVIAPRLQGGDSGQLFKTAAIIAITVYTGGLAGAAFGAGSFAAGLITAGATIGATLLLNSLIPPPVPAGQDLSGVSGGGDVSSSQMYSVSGQSNSLRKLGTVPKVYGEHRMFPIVAASPYTEIETDPSNGKQIQYFYAIYDFGMGPCAVRDIKIGDTPIYQFSDVSYRLVDFHKPDVSEGVWDDVTVNQLSFYKGDVERDSVSVVLDKDQSSSIPVSDYQSVRQASPNTNLVEQEVTVTLAFQGGLYAYNAAGTRGPRNVDLLVEFSKVGEENWKGFNDLDHVRDYSSTGGDNYYAPTQSPILPYNFNEYATLDQQLEYKNIPFSSIFYKVFNRWKGLPTGSTSIIMQTNADIVGSRIFFFGDLIGTVISESATGYPGYTRYHFDTPTRRPYSFFKLIFEFSFAPPDVPGNNPQGTEDLSIGNTLFENLSLGKLRVTRDDTSTVYSTVRFIPREFSSYKVRVTRVQSFSTFTQTIRDNMSWVGISTRFNKEPIKTDKRHTFLEIKIRATNQLNGPIQTLSAVCHSAIPVWDGTTWTRQLTSNPAWVFCDLLTGEINKRPVPRSRLHLPSILEWANHCSEVPPSPPSMDYANPRFRCDFILDYTPSLQSVLGQVANAANASLNIIDGKYGVLLDVLKTTPVQIFTPRNSSGFSSTRSYSKKPQGVKVSFVEPNADWEVRERVVYDNGFDESTALELDSITAFACTNMEQAFRFGRYLLAQNRLRQETIRLTVDFENLVCSRGDYVQITQDVMKAGGTPARVKSVSGNTVVIDDAIETLPIAYGFIYRSTSQGQIFTNTLTVVSADTFDFDGTDIPEPGDLVIIGAVGSIAIDCIVKSIEPSGDMSATLTLVEKADAIYTSEYSDDLPTYDPNLSPTVNGDFVAPGEVEGLAIVDNYFECTSGSGLAYKVSLDWNSPGNAATDLYEVWVNAGRGYNQIASTKESFYIYDVLRSDLGAEHKFKVLAVSAAGKKLDIGSVGEVVQVITSKTTPPSDVANLNIDITGEVVQLFWDKVPDCSNNEYLLRYSPLTTSLATWERSIPLMRVDRNTTTTSTQGRVGTYLIKAIDFEGNESANATRAITTIPNLFGLNIVDTTTDFPTLAGTKDRVRNEGGSLILKNVVSGGVDTSEYYSEGYYYYENFLDLGEIYTVRLQSLIQAEGYTLQDLMSNWTTLAALDAMSHAGFSDWDVETQYRGTDVFNVMSDWVLLSDINPISEGNQDNFTPWKKFTIGDATARIFQFRLKLISNKVSVSPRVFDGVIKADMPDRQESFDNISVSTSGQAIVYSPAFKGPGSSPNIQVSMDSASSGDYWTFDYKTLDGFYIRFFDKDGNPVSRNADFLVKGYGRKALAII